MEPENPTPPQGEPGRSWSGLMPRIVTGLVLALGALALVIFASLGAIIILAALAAGLCMWEYTRMCLPGPWNTRSLAGLVLAAGVALSTLAGPAAVAGGLLLALALMAAVCLAGGGEPARRLQELQARLWGVIYAGGLMACLLLVLIRPGGRPLILFLLLTVVAADTGAYFSGHLLGRHQMAPRLSPGKTLEGLAGGLLAGSLAAGVYAALLLPDTGFVPGLVLGLVMAGFSVLGDLLESVLKRASGVKDSGGILPGHGGLLDRLDGILMAAPPLLLARVWLWG